VQGEAEGKAGKSRKYQLLGEILGWAKGKYIFMDNLVFMSIYCCFPTENARKFMELPGQTQYHFHTPRYPDIYSYIYN